VRLGEQRGTQVGRPDGVGLVEHQPPPGVEAGRGHPESKREEERQQAKARGNDRTHRGFPLVFRAPLSPSPDPKAGLDD
jgi:hypothetical protein